MKSVTKDIVEEITDAIVREVSPVRIILFGSRARGDAQPDSDVDLMVVEQGPFGPGHTRREELSRIRHALAGAMVPIDILVYTTEEAEKWKNAKNHVVARAHREGKVLYDRT